MREINLTDAEGAFDRHIAFLDARRTPDYLEGHVPGAVSLPVWEDGLEARITRWEAGSALAPKDPIVVYCSAGCEDSRLLAGKLVALGYRNLLIYTGGFPEWLGASRPVAAGARP
jgi:rhodanese-related sulfurtransferase